MGGSGEAALGSADVFTRVKQKSLFALAKSYVERRRGASDPGSSVKRVFASSGVKVGGAGRGLPARAPRPM